MSSKIIPAPATNPFHKNSNVQNVIAYGLIDGPNSVFSFSAPMNVDFQPDEIILKHIDCAFQDLAGSPGVGDGKGMYTIRSSLVDGTVVNFSYTPVFYVDTGSTLSIQPTYYSQPCDIS